MSDLPAAGWFPDPEGAPGTLRYWDGAVWTEHRHVQGSHAQANGSFEDIGSWLGRSFESVGARWQELLAFGLVTFVPAGVLVSAAFAFGAKDLVLVGGDDSIELVGFDVSNGVISGLLFLLSMVLSAVGSLGLVYLLDEQLRGRSPNIGEIFAVALSKLPRAIGWFLLMVVVLIAAMFVFIIFVFITGGAGLLLLFGLVPLAIWAWVKLNWLVVAIVLGQENPFRLSAAVSQNRWWPAFGRLLLLAIMTLVVGGIIGGLLNALGLDQFGSNIEQPQLTRSGSFQYWNIGQDLEMSPRLILGAAVGAIFTQVLIGAWKMSANVQMYRKVHAAPVDQVEQDQ